MGEPIRVLVVDDHPVVRQGLRTFLDLQGDIAVVGEAADGEACVAAAEQLRPDVVLLDLRMPEADGLVALRGLRERGKGARVLVITSFTDPAAVLPAVRAGAAGYVCKDVDPPALAAAIAPARRPRAASSGRGRAAGGRRRAAAGDGPAHRAGVRGVDRGSARPVQREIARALALSEKTVKTHVSSVLTKLGVQDRTQAALFAVRSGLLE